MVGWIFQWSVSHLYQKREDQIADQVEMVPSLAFHQQLLVGRIFLQQALHSAPKLAGQKVCQKVQLKLWQIQWVEF